MKDSGGQAFPGALGPVPPKQFSVGSDGMTMRQWYKGQAPDQAPSWFEHHRQPRPERPELDICPFMPPGDGGASPKLQARVDNWRDDPCYDLADTDPAEEWTDRELVAWKDYWKAQRVWKIRDQEDRYFQWRGYYADAMIAEDKKAEEDRS